MKKLASLLLALVMLLSLCACGAAEESASPVAEGLGGVLQQAFRSLAAAEPDMSPLAMAEALMANEAIVFAPVTMTVEPGYLNGFGDQEITGFAEAAIFAPMIGSIPFVGYIFRLEENADAEAFVEMLEGQANLRWNICTEAEQLVTERSGSLVFFVMCPLSVEE